MLSTWSEDARNYLITGNTIRDTQEIPTQFVGINENNGPNKGGAVRADENIIKGNIFSGHKTADILLAGAKTVVEDNGGAKIVQPTAAETK